MSQDFTPGYTHKHYQMRPLNNMYAQTGITTPRIVKTLKPLQEVKITGAGKQIIATPEITEENRRILTHLNATP